MSHRTDFLTYLSGLSTPANRWIGFEEGVGTPAEGSGAGLMTVSGSWSWIADGTYGSSFKANAANASLTWPEVGNLFLNGGNQTLLIIRRKTDSTLRNAQVQGLNTGNNNEKFDFYNSFGDGHAYADYGGNSGNNRLDLAGYTPSTTREAWAMRVGSRGISIWKDGSLFGTPKFTAVTRNNPAAAVWLNRGFLNQGDIQEFYFVAMVPYELSDIALQNFTVGNVLLGQAPPVISTTSPLTDGQQDVAYSNQLTNTGGTGTVVYSKTAGTFPTGISISSTGLISGTPTEAGLFHFTIQTLDDAGNSFSASFDLYIDDPLCIPTAVGSLARGSFTNNSRVGPHQDDAKKIALILRDADNVKKLNAQYSSNNGVTWTSVLTSALTNNIVSHDSELGPDGHTVHVWTQESTSGRVAYHQFDLTTGTWTLENEQISAAETIITGAVTGTILSSGVAAIVYESTRENVSAANRNRLTYNDRVGGVWGTALPMGNIGAAQSDKLGRLVPGANNRSTLFTRLDPGTSVLSTPDFQLQVIRSNRTLSSLSVFRTTGLLGTNPDFAYGNWTTYINGSDLILVVPVKFGGEPTIFSFVDSDTPPGASIAEPVLGNFVGEGSFAPIVVKELSGTLYFLDFGWPNLIDPSFIRLKTSTSHLGPFSPSGMANQAGPTMGVITTTTQTMDGNVLVRTCDEVDSIYITTAVPIGTIDGITSQVKFEWLKVADLPTSSSLTLQNWLDALETQEVEFCCTPAPVINSTCPLPLATVGEEYEFQLDGDHISSWVIEEGSLPSGWTLSIDGLISSNGVVTEDQIGGFQFKVRVS